MFALLRTASHFVFRVLGSDKIPHSVRFLLALSMAEWYFVSFSSIYNNYLCGH